MPGACFRWKLLVNASSSSVILLATQSINRKAEWPAFLNAWFHWSSSNSRRNDTASDSSLCHCCSNVAHVLSNSLHAVGKFALARPWKVDNLIGKKSKEARSGCILARRLNKEEFCWLIDRLPDERNNELIGIPAERLKEFLGLVKCVVVPRASAIILSRFVTSNPTLASLCETFTSLEQGL